MTTTSWYIVRLAITSRIFIIFLQWLSNCLIPDHDAGVFLAPKSLERNHSLCDKIIETSLGGFHRWDAQYFLHIAEHGYTYENTLAFYPLFPFIVRHTVYFVSTVLPFLETDCSMQNQLLFFAVMLNIIFFVNATNSLYKLSRLVFNDRHFSRIVVILFCFNPASIFFTAPYTESLFSWLTFTVMLNCTQYRFKRAILPLIGSIWCRSNGILNFGFIAFFLTKFIFKQNHFQFSIVLRQFSKLLFFAMFLVTSFGIIQFYFYLLYCTEYSKFKMASHVIQYGVKNHLVMAGNFGRSIWCEATIPISYSYIQSHYWNVGLFQYYELKQIPNFLLATPILFLMLNTSVIFFCKNLKITFHLGLASIKSLETLSNQFIYILHGFALTCFCLLFVHIQVSTRMLASSSPCLYWFAARYALYEIDESNGTIHLLKSIILLKTSRGKLITIWFLSYTIIGTILFCNFLPWT